MRIEILITGRGGQGILFMGRLLGKALSKYTNYYVIGSESYSAEVRGGDSRVDIIIADREEDADFIKVYRANIAIFMHQAQLEAYKDLVDERGVVFIDKSNLSDPSIIPRTWIVYSEPYTDIARTIIGLARVANLIALGHMIHETKLIDPKGVENVILEEFSYDNDLLEKNLRAFRYYLEKSRD